MVPSVAINLQSLGLSMASQTDDQLNGVGVMETLLQVSREGRSNKHAQCTMAQ